jgi:hypothetical protein
VRFAAKQNSHRPGIASALGLRAGGSVFIQYTADLCHMGDANNVFFLLAALLETIP